jgi:hypothetical protein
VFDVWVGVAGDVVPRTLRVQFVAWCGGLFVAYLVVSAAVPAHWSNRLRVADGAGMLLKMLHPGKQWGAAAAARRRVGLREMWR